MEIKSKSTIGSFFGNYFNFNGVATRKEYWAPVLLVPAVWLVSLIIVVIIMTAAPSLTFLVFAPYAWIILCLIPVFSVTVRRLHDTGRSGAWIFIGLVPFGVFILLFFLASDSSNNEKYEDKSTTNISTVKVNHVAIQETVYSVRDLVEMCQSKNPNIRKIALEQPNMPEPWIKVLLDDEDSSVRELAHQKLFNNVNEVVDYNFSEGARSVGLKDFRKIINDSESRYISIKVDELSISPALAVFYSNGIMFITHGAEDDCSLLFDVVEDIFYQEGSYLDIYTKNNHVLISDGVTADYVKGLISLYENR